MHNKRMTKDECEKVRKSLKSINKLLLEAISVIEDEIYTDTKLIEEVYKIPQLDVSKLHGIQG